MISLPAALLQREGFVYALINRRVGILIIKKTMYAWMFLTPTLVLFTLIFAYPLITVVVTGFTDWEFLEKPVFNGIENYICFFKDADTYTAFINNIVWIVLQSTVHVGVGLLVALYLHRKRFYWKFVRTVVMIPNIISIAALGVVMLLLFHPTIGPVNGLIRLFGNPEFSKNWFFSSDSAFFTLTLTWIFYAGLIVILLLTEMASLPESMYESAQIDGASIFRQNVSITIPCLRNMIGTCTLLAATSRLTDFTMIILTTNGGPGNKTLSLPLLLYRKISILYDFGKGNAIGTVIIMFGLVLILIINKIYRIGDKD